MRLGAQVKSGSETKGEGTLGIPKFFFSATGSHLIKRGKAKTYRIDSMASAFAHLQEHQITRVVDDFHYLEPAARQQFLRNIKGPVFNGLRVVLLSVTHRAFEPIKEETELTGRFAAIIVPEWDPDDLKKIATAGFTALNV